MKCWQEIKVKLWNWNADCRLQMHNKDWKVWTSFCIRWMDFILVRQMDLQVQTFEDGRLVVVEVVLQCSPLCINPRPPSSSWSTRLLGEVPSHHSRAPHHYQLLSVLSRHPPREQSPTLIINNKPNLFETKNRQSYDKKQEQKQIPSIHWRRQKDSTWIS